jgi:hypothetical protein
MNQAKQLTNLTLLIRSKHHVVTPTFAVVSCSLKMSVVFADFVFKYMYTNVPYYTPIFLNVVKFLYHVTHGSMYDFS